MNKRDREYLNAWEQLDDETKAELAAAGINGPDLESKSVFHPEYNADVAVEPNEPFAGIEMDKQSRRDFVLKYFKDEVDEISEERFCSGLRRVFGELMQQTNLSLSIECFSLVTGLAYLGDSMTEIAKRHGVTRAAVSKRCIQVVEAWGLRPSRAMRFKNKKEMPGYDY